MQICNIFICFIYVSFTWDVWQAADKLPVLGKLDHLVRLLRAWCMASSVQVANNVSIATAKHANRLEQALVGCSSYASIVARETTINVLGKARLNCRQSFLRGEQCACTGLSVCNVDVVVPSKHPVRRVELARGIPFPAPRCRALRWCDVIKCGARHSRQRSKQNEKIAVSRG